jgi:signal transduction histidine kinase
VRADEHAERERLLLESSERRIARLAFDLHDGPLQSVAALAADVRHFRSHLADVAFDANRERVLGCVDDLEARLVTLDSELRELLRDHARTLIDSQPFSEILGEEIDAFKRHAQTRAELLLDGDFGSLTESQRTVLIRFVQEALANVRAHSGATRVAVSVTARNDHIEAVVTDDGGGFDVEPTLARATKDRRLGLIAMRERARFLGGALAVDSKPGGPTVVSVLVPARHRKPRSAHVEALRHSRRRNR